MADLTHAVPVLDRLDLLALPVQHCISSLPIEVVSQIAVIEIDPEVADTAAFCARYGFSPEQSVNCVVIAGKRGDITRYAACNVLATTRADVNGAVRRRLDSRKASFAPTDDAVLLTNMEYGGITPFGLPADWPVLVDSAVIDHPLAVFGSGLRRSKLLAPGKVLTELATVEIVEGLGLEKP